MKRLFIHCFAFLFALFPMIIFSQDLPEIVPLSPNAASIAKYGEIPVGHFTGVPNIGIPIYTISSGELTLPLSLSYHAGGNKVESIASWVGLGWSLGSVPSISRRVQGIPDEGAGGYFDKFSNKTVYQLWNERNTNTTAYGAYKEALYNGTADSEPDIFSYSLPEESGKFFYNQEEGTFITFPKSNLKITRNGNNFTLVTQNGVEYYFNIIETTISNGDTQGKRINSTWYASTITSPSKKDIIRFSYQMENHITKTKNVVNKYHYLGGVTNGLPSDSGSLLTINSTNAIVVDSILFDEGYIKFNRNVGYRDDLDGGKSLNNVSVYDAKNELLSKHQFTYRYKQGTAGGTSCYNADSYSRRWMLLDKIEQVSVTDPDIKLSHLFTYNENGFPSCRYSAAQDYWGYYNGEDLNADLTPPYYLPGQSNQISGAERGVDPTKSHYGILTKITYPTGGYTEFDFENNMVYANDLPPQYVSNNQILAGEEYFDAGDTPDGTDLFQKTFTINNPTDPVLNNNNINGGANVSFTIGNPGCDLSGGSNPCALFTITTPTSNMYYIQIEGSSFYLPNGTYTMTASFNQPYPGNDYQDFYFIANWQEIDPNQSGNTYSGGLRIKQIRSYVNATSQPMTKNYKYTTTFDSSVSSGDVFSTPNFSHVQNVTYNTLGNGQNGGGSFTSLLLRVRSVSNVQQVTHSGSAVGYRTVFEEIDNANERGYTEYQFSNSRDEGNDSFPYPPAESLELERGQLLRQKSFKKASTGFDLVQDKHLTYTKVPFDIGSVHPKSSFAIKWGSLIIDETQNPLVYLDLSMIDYFVKGGWYNLFSEDVTNYYDNAISTTSTYFYYDNPVHLLKTRTETIDSKGERLVSIVKYPQDIGSPTVAESGLIAQNRLGEIIETSSYMDLNNNLIADSNELLSKQQSDYRIWYNDIISPEYFHTSKGANNAPENRVIFHSYHENGKVKEVSKTEGAHIVYIWGYDQTLPVAKIENATFGQIPTTVYNAILSASNSDIDDLTEDSLRSELEKLRDPTYCPNLSNALVTTYTYDPLIGVTSMTDPKGYTVFFEYDGFSRLERVKDGTGNILSNNRYHYKNQ